MIRLDLAAVALAATLSLAACAGLGGPAARGPDRAEMATVADGLLFEAAAQGRADVMASLVDLGADPNAKTEANGLTPLMIATAGGHLAAATMLIALGADLAATDLDGFTPLHWAVAVDQPDAAGILLDAGAPVDEREKTLGHTPLMEAALLGYADMAALLLDHGASLQAQDAALNSAPIHFAASARGLGGTETTAELLVRGAPVDAVRSDGRTPLMLAALAANPATVDLLIGEGADVDHRDGRGTTTLMVAAARGDIASIDRLLRAGADAGAANDDGVTALAVAEAAGHPEAAAFIRQHAR